MALRQYVKCKEFQPNIEFKTQITLINFLEKIIVRESAGGEKQSFSLYFIFLSCVWQKLSLVMALSRKHAQMQLEAG